MYVMVKCSLLKVVLQIITTWLVEQYAWEKLLKGVLKGKYLKKQDLTLVLTILQLYVKISLKE